jgi:hypothetical protein
VAINRVFLIFTSVKFPKFPQIAVYLFNPASLMWWWKTVIIKAAGISALS